MFQFPLNPTIGQQFVPSPGIVFRWNGTAWYLIAGPGSFLTQIDADLRYVQLSQVPFIQNKIINGKFAIDQRAAGAASGVSTVAVYTLDRWNCIASGGGTVVVQREVDLAFPGEFRCKLLPSVADTPLAVGDIYAWQQLVEGVNCNDLYWGTANAQPITIAFEIESNLLGTFPLAVGNAAANRAYVTTFTVNAINTRQTVTLTIPGDQTGVWLTDNGIGLRVTLGLGLGTNFNAAAANVWGAGNLYSVAGTTNFMANTANIFRLKGFRLYRGSQDFGPDTRLYEQEFSLCQRYYWKTYLLNVLPTTLTLVAVRSLMSTGSGGQWSVTVPYPIIMRATPAALVFNPAAANAQARDVSASLDCTGTSAVAAFTGDTAVVVSGTAPVGSVLGNFIAFHLTCNAEL